MLCPHGQGGLSQCGHFADKEEGSQLFTILCVRPYVRALKRNHPRDIESKVSFQFIVGMLENHYTEA